MKTIIQLILILSLFAIVAQSQETPPPLRERKPVEHQTHSGNKSDINPKTAKTITDALPSPVIDKATTTPENSSSNAGGKKNTRLDDGSKNDPMVRYTFWLMIFTGLLAISTIGLWVVTFFSGKDTKKAADAAQRSAKVAETALIIAQRAYVHNASSLALPIRDNKNNIQEWQFGIIWENVGQSPAFHVTAGCTLVIGHPPATELNISPPFSTMSIGPKHSVRSVASPITKEQVRSILTEKTAVYLCGIAVYKDAFGDETSHRTSVCMKIDVINPAIDSQNAFSFTAYEKYNDAT